jgi:hypothetical protein
MTFIAVRCPHCQSDQIVKRGKTGCGTQRYLCQNTTCTTGSFLLDYRYLGRLPEVKHQIIEIDPHRDGSISLRPTADLFNHTASPSCLLLRSILPS